MKKLITILGPTACGKTSVATALAARTDGEILSADSRQVYRRMDIGTGKDLDDYIVDGQTIPYHLIDICEPGTKYNLFQYQQDFLKAYNYIVGRQKQPILCGGTGLYLEAVLGGYALSPVPQNPELRQQLEGKSLEELTQMLVELKAKTGSTMHNQTDVDTAQHSTCSLPLHNARSPTSHRSSSASTSNESCDGNASLRGSKPDSTGEWPTRCASCSTAE